jgi:hypothetical protein
MSEHSPPKGHEPPGAQPQVPRFSVRNARQGRTSFGERPALRFAVLCAPVYAFFPNPRPRFGVRATYR